MSATSRRVAVMQPYFLPYLGYWQLLAAVDEFVVYDTVQYSSGGWINRNRIRAGDEIRWITVPLARAPHRTPIRDRRITADDGWRTTMRQQVAAASRTAARRSQGLDLLDRTLAFGGTDLTAFLTDSISAIARDLGIPATIHRASDLPAPAPGAGAEERVIALCGHLGATDYYNLSGGAALYHAERFRSAGLGLHFRVPPASAPEGTEAHDDQTLSILDLTMRHDIASIAALVADARWAIARPATDPAPGAGATSAAGRP